MESDSAIGGLTFETLYAQLLAFVDHRIRNGEFSERALAKLMGVSQPHFNNVRSGKRRLQKDLADTILERFHMTILDLLTLGDMTSVAERLKSGALGFAKYPAIDSNESNLRNRDGQLRFRRKYTSKIKRDPPKF